MRGMERLTEIGWGRIEEHGSNLAKVARRAEVSYYETLADVRSQDPDEVGTERVLDALNVSDEAARKLNRFATDATRGGLCLPTKQREYNLTIEESA